MSRHTIRQWIAFVLFIGVVVVSAPANASPMDDFIAEKKEECDQLTQEIERLTRLATQQATAASPSVPGAVPAPSAQGPPPNTEALAVVNALVNDVRKWLDEGPPDNAPDRNAYITRIEIAFKMAGVQYASIRRRIIKPPLNIDVERLSKRYGWDGERGSYDATPQNINIERRRDSDFFSLVGCLGNVTGRADAGEVTLGSCRACTEDEKEARIAKLRQFRNKELDGCLQARQAR